jgi:hypothetical protein
MILVVLGSTLGDQAHLTKGIPVYLHMVLTCIPANRRMKK